MENIKKSFYEMKFELFFYKERGNGFEDFFSRVMKMKYKEDFVEVKTWGNKGDLKCDGFLKSEGVIFQLYAPNEINSQKLMNKFEEDHSLAVQHWQYIIKEWVFVQNSKDGVKGLEAPTLLSIETYIQKNPNSVPINVWGIDEIKNIVFSLSENDLENLLGPVPGMENLQQLQVKHIEPFIIPFKTLHGLNLQPQEILEVSKDKISVNNFSDYIQNLLKIGMRKAHLIDLIITKNPDVDLIQNMADLFNKKYLELKSDSLSSDDIFYKLKEFAGWKETNGPIEEMAVLTILSFLFEKCTIFEDKPIEDKLNV